MSDLQREWLELDHFVHRSLKLHAIHDMKILLAVSGGLDSVALLKVFARIRKASHLEIEVCYVHHGPAKNTLQDQFRSQADVFIKQLCLQEDIIYHAPQFSVNSQKLNSEAEFRKYRYDQFSQLMKQRNLQVLALAHHSDDLLETRMIRLIRGVGPDGIESMSEFSGNLYRPFLRSSKQELKLYLSSLSQSWLDDPSNQETDYLRNWLRDNWFKSLEGAYPGSIARLSDSLQNLSESLEQFNFAVYVDTRGIDRMMFAVLSREQKKRVIAYYLNLLQVKNFTGNHLNEILKYLDISQIVHTFKVAGCDWQANAERISVRVVAPHGS